MGGVLCRAAEIGNETGAFLVITEVESGKDGKQICKLGPGEGIYIKGRQFISRSRGSRIHRTIRVTALIDQTAPCVLAANYFAKNGKVTFRLVNGKLKCYPVVIPDPRRLRWVARGGAAFVSR